MSEQKLKNILKMSLKLTPQEEADALQSSPQIDPERKEFLDKAIKQAIEEDDSVKIVSITQMFLSFKPTETYDEENLQYLERIYEELNYLNEGFDIAKIFNSQGGMKHNLEFLKSSPHPNLKIEAANLIGNSTHNNPTLQVTILEHHGLILLLYNIKNSDSDELVVKCLYALSTLVGGNDYAEKELCKLVDGNFFMKMMERDNEKMKTKSAFLLLKLVNSEAVSSILLEKIITTELIIFLLDMLKSSNVPYHSHVVQLLVTCLTKFQPTTLLSESQINETIKTFENKKELMLNEDKELYEREIEGLKMLISRLKKVIL